MTRVIARTSVRGNRTPTVDPIEGTDGLLSVVHDVELCAVGIEYPLASGPTTFTPEDLQEAVASQSDPAIQSPRVWLGHPDDQRFHAGRTTPAGSAEPALGKVTNMRVEDQGMTLVGDVMGCPTWLAKILASAYPSRSVEGFKDAETVTGHKWRLVITDLALLGVTWPGVSTLDDLEALYSENGPDNIEVEEEDLTVAAARAINAQVNVDDIRRSFYSALGDMTISSWSWIRAMQLDPNELIVDDDEGNLYRVPFEMSGEDVSFGDPQEVKIQYVTAQQKRDPEARALLVNYFTDGKKVAASWTVRAKSRPENDNQENTMTPEQLRAAIGLPADATDEQVQARMAEINAAAPRAEEGTPSEGPATPGESGNPSAPAVPAVPPVTTPGTTDPHGTPSPDQVPDPNAPNPANLEGEPALAAARETLQKAGLIVVPAEAWTTVQAGAAAGARVAQATEAQRRDGIITAAVKEGRIAPAQKDNFRAMYDRDPQGTEVLLTAAVDKGGLMPNTIPVQARGGDPAPISAEDPGYPKEWLPEVTQHAAPSSIPNVTMEA